MLKWFRPKQPEAPTWKAAFAIPIRSATAPEWVTSLQAEKSDAVQATFFLRREVPEWILEEEEFKPILDQCQGVALMKWGYREHPNPTRRGKAFLGLVDLTLRFAQKEAGLAANVLAYRFYRAEEWLPKINEFLLEDHYTTHMVYEENEHGTQWLHTHGLIQFDIPEIEIREVPPELIARGNTFIEMMARFIFYGERYEDGHTLGASEEHLDVWAICKSVRSSEEEAHEDEEYPLLRFSDYDQETGEVKAGISRYLEAMGDDPLGEVDNS